MVKNSLSQNAVSLEQEEWLTILHDMLRMGNYGGGTIKNYNVSGGK